MPVLLLRHGDLVKTVQFRKPTYVGDPINAVRIFNDKRVDELILLDIAAADSTRKSETELLGQIASEAFMPVAFGGGIATLAQVERILKLGVEKVIINTAAFDSPAFITDIVNQFGSQSVVISIDVRRSVLGAYRVYTRGAGKATGTDPVSYARRMRDAGAGEILVTSAEREGTGRGYDIALTRAVADAVDIPVIANGGASTVADFVTAVRDGHASAVAASSMFIYYGKHRAVLISFPEEATLRRDLFSLRN